MNSSYSNFQLNLTIAIFWTKFVQIKHRHWILRIRICLWIKFYFDQTILNSWTKFAQERYLWLKTEKVNIIIEFCIFKSVLVPNFRLNWQFWSFWPDLPKKDFPGLKQKKWAQQIFHRILHIYISLVQNFSSNWQFWFFGPNFPKKVFPVKNIILRIHISLERNFSSNWQFWFFGPNLPRKVFLVKDRKNEHYHGLVHNLISLGTKYQLQLIILSFWTKFTQKRCFQSKTEQAVLGLKAAYAFCVVNVNSTVVFKYFEDLIDLIILNILKEKFVVFCLLGSFYLKIV